MPRIRSLKPEFWESEDVEALSPLGRLAFIWLISHADDEGRLRASPDHVARKTGIPAKTVEAQLERMHRRRMVILYADSDGVPLIAVANFRKHQVINKPTVSQLPPPPPTPAGEQTSLFLNSIREDYSSTRGSRARARALRSSPIHSSPIPSGGSGGNREVTPRVAELAQGVEEVLGRQPTAKSVDLLWKWDGLRRQGEPIAVPEILAVVRDQMATRLADGTLPRNLAFCDDAVTALVRGPYKVAPNGRKRSQARDAEPPASAGDLEALREAYSEPDEGAALEFDAEGATLVEEYRQAAEVARQAQERADGFKAQVMLQLGDREVGLWRGRPLVTWRGHEERRLDEKALRARHPKLAARFTRARTVRRLLVTPPDEETSEEEE